MFFLTLTGLRLAIVADEYLGKRVRNFFTIFSFNIGILEAVAVTMTQYRQKGPIQGPSRDYPLGALKQKLNRL